VDIALGRVKKLLPFLLAVAVLTYVIGWHVWGVLYGLGVHPYPAPSTPWTYQLWSGFIPALAIVSIFGGITTHFRMLNCHVHGCWRLGRFELAGGQFKVCRKHSPHPDKLTAGYIAAKHQEHLDCLKTGYSPSSGPASSSISSSESLSPLPTTFPFGPASTSPPSPGPQSGTGT
jgi:hypothetical protein